LSNYSSDATDKAGPLLGKLLLFAGLGALLALGAASCVAKR
jgi:hypothetical protein